MSEEIEVKDTTPKYPKEGTNIRIVWEICDKLHGEGTAPTYKAVAPLVPEEPEIKDNTVKAQIQRWRMYMGMVNPRGPREQEETAAA